jgi:N-acetylglucosamine-6-phosphate deacetylase
VVGERVEAVGLSPPGVGIAVPGFVDLQVNGFAGVDFLAADPDQILSAGAALAATGVVAYQPTLITSPLSRTIEAAGAIAQAGALPSRGARIVGIHLEGPFLSPRRPGTHPTELLREPDWDLVAPILAAGPVRMVTMAPELPGAGELITRLARAGVVVSLGHSDATAAEASAGFDSGARAVTHLFNAMRPFTPRDPGIAGAALSRESINLGVIADGIHLSAETILMVWRAAPDRMLIVTDAIAAAGDGEGTYTVGEVLVEVAGGVARRADGTLAGSVGTMDSSFRYLLDIGIPLADVVRATSETPRRLMGLPPASLRPGGLADIAVLDDRYRVIATLVGGEIAV